MKVETQTPDIYQQAVDYFTQHPEDIHEAWNKGANAITAAVLPVHIQDYAVALFGQVPNGTGCLTQIRDSNILQAATLKLTAAIKADNRIPLFGSNITPETLPVFAEWQRKLHQP